MMTLYAKRHNQTIHDDHTHDPLLSLQEMIVKVCEKRKFMRMELEQVKCFEMMIARRMEKIKAESECVKETADQMEKEMFCESERNAELMDLMLMKTKLDSDEKKMKEDLQKVKQQILLLQKELEN